MSWEDRLKPASITTPDDRTYSFIYEDVSKSFVNKTSRYIFSQKTNAFVRNFGVGAVDIPLRIIFNGENYDLTAKQFDVSAGLPGTCTLNHPIYGIKTVVIETVGRADNLKSGGNEAVFDVLMVETIIQDVPLADAENKSSLFGKIDNFVEQAGIALDDAIYNVENNAFFSFAKSRWNAAINTYSNIFDAVINSSDALREKFDIAVNEFQGNLDVLLNKPQELASSVTQLFRIPTEAPVLAQTKNDTYYDTISALQVPVEELNLDSKNRRLEIQTNITGLLVGACESNLLASEDGKSFVTRTDAINAALELIDTFNTVQEFLDVEQQTSEAAALTSRFVVSDLNTQNLVGIVKVTAGNLIRLSFSLKQERILELTEDRHYIELSYELYGSTETETLEFLASTNDFEGDDYVELKRGREIKYYV